MYIGPHVRYLLFLLDVNETWNFWLDFRKISRYQIEWKSSSGIQVVSCGRTDGHDEIIVDFRNFAIAPKNPPVILLK